MSPQLLTLDDVARRPEPGMDAPGSAVFAPDGRSITYLHSPDGSLVRSLWRHDLASGKRVEIAVPLPETTREETLSRADHLLRERTGAIELGVTSFAWAGDAQEPTLLIPMNGRLFVAFGPQIERGVHEIAGADHAGGASLSPDGRFVSFSMGGDLHVAAVHDGPPRRITHDAEEGVFNGLAEFAAAEELGRFEGAWWSADSQFLAFAHVDERGIPPITIAHATGSEPRDEVHHYPFAGGPNAHVTLRIASIPGSAWGQVFLPMQADDYLARVVADPSGGWLVAVLPRAQRTLEWLRVGVDGSTEALWTEESEPWINLDDDTRVLADGRILRSTERSGFRHLELRSPAGDLERVLTQGEWAVTSVVAISAARGEVLFTGTRDGVLERHLYAVPVDPAEPTADPERLSTEPGWHTVVAAPDGERWIDTWSDLRHAPRLTVETREGDSVLIHASSTTAEEAQLDPPELVELVAADGRTTLHAAVYRSAAPRGAPAPAALWVYGGPHWQYVKNDWELTAFGLRQYLAQHGATVVVVDSRGTESRGLAFESAVNRQMGWNEVADQAGALRQLAARGELDLGRVGVVGASYGGFMSIMAMAREPDLFGTGVAVAPVSEWIGYDTAYTERYLGLPSENADGYRESSALMHVGAVHGDLLLIHGTVDENVHLRHSERLVEAFHGAGRKVELVRLPEQRHRTRGGAIRVREQRTIAHLLRGLGLPLPEELG
ncbi:MAG TPA: DPP IV N-terminal domain-containing protein [Candidatus Limnocylindria bacterium]